ncbi:hypothetical protein PWT90_09756 [Aphanocladium album]|nr:hypothetical protein PWT90_09756 [Aphanocladium album]
MWPFASKCTLNVEASFSHGEGRAGHTELCSSPTYGTYIYPSGNPSRQGRLADRAACRCDGRRSRVPDEPEHRNDHRRCRCYDGREPPHQARPSPARSSGEDHRRVVLEVVDRTAPLSHHQRDCARRRHQPRYSISVSVRASTEDVIDRLVNDADAQDVRVYWRGGDSELLRRSISVRELANDAVYLEIRNRRSSCRRC